MFMRVASFAAVFMLAVACRSESDATGGGGPGLDASADSGSGGSGGSAGAVGAGGFAGSAAAGGSAGADAGGDAASGAPEVILGTFNLHNFSKYGDAEFRIDDIATKIDEVNADVLGVQELKVKEGTTGAPPQAWDALLTKLPTRDGTHGKWNTFDSTVGFIWNTATTTLLSEQSLFESDNYAFPRAPLHARFRVSKQGAATEVNVIVVHLKAFQSSYERRRDACKKLRGFIDGQSDKHFVVLGDFNDDPYDGPADNSYVGTFLDQQPAYHFLTQQLPPVSVTSTGFYHYVNGKKITGEFLDHVIATGEWVDNFTSATPKIFSVPESGYAAWEKDYSDHFPVIVTFTP